MTTPASAAKAALRLKSDAEARIDDLQVRYPTKAATLLHVLWEIQEQEAWIAPEWMEYAAERCGVPISKVLGVVSFYTMYHQKPPGKYHVEVCRNITCAMLGAFDILHCVEKKLGIGHGERTADAKFSLEEVECLAGCSWAPAMRVNGRYHEQMTPEKAAQLLDSLE